MNEQGMTISSPILVIGVGDFAGSLVSQVQTLFLRSDLHRSAMVGFYKAVAETTEQGEMKLEPAQVQQEQLSLGLETVLHDLRLHEKVLQAGLGDEQDLPLGVIVLIDLTEDGSDSLYPLMTVLSERMEQERGGYMYLLCKTAVFNTDPLKNVLQARVHLHLGKRKAQVELIDLGVQTYLFDGLKEGSLEAKDDDEVSILMQNFLLALLSGDLAQRLAHVYALSEKNEARGFCNSAGTTALIYDPSILQESCAKRLAEETLETEFLSPVLPDPRQMEKVANEIFKDMGTIKEWAENLRKETPYRVDPAETLKLDLHFSDLQFDGLPPHEWGDAIAGYATHFEQQVQPLCLETLAKNSSALIEAVPNTMESQLRALPARMDLYPNGLANSLNVLQECVRSFQQRIQICLPAQDEEQTLIWLQGEYQASMDSLDQAISELPDPPHWVRCLPGKLYALAKTLFEFIFLRTEHAQLLLLREKIVQALERIYLFQYELQLRKSMIKLCNQLISSLEANHSELKELQTKFNNLKNLLGQESPASQYISSPFRQYMVSPVFLDWAYRRAQKSSSAIRAELLEGNFLDNWQNSSEEYLLEGLIFACRPVFQFLHDMHVDAVLKQACSADQSASVALLAQGAVPALRSDFDTTGESSSYLMNYFLCPNTHGSGIKDMLKTSIHEWQEITTGDPYSIIFCRVRQMIPLDALSFLTQSTAAASSRLSADVQKGLQTSFERQHS